MLERMTELRFEVDEREKTSVDKADEDPKQIVARIILSQVHTLLLSGCEFESTFFFFSSRLNAPPTTLSRVHSSFIYH